MATKILLSIIFFALMSFIMCEDVVNINLANLYSNACSCSGSTSTASCESLSCSNSTEMQYCKSNCCVDQDTCTCTNITACSFSASDIYASTRIAGESFGDGLNVKLFVNLRISTNAAPSKFGQIMYRIVWTDLQEDFVTITLYTVSNETLVSFDATNTLDKADYNGYSVGNVSLTTEEANKLFAAGTWLVRARIGSENRVGDSLFTKFQPKKASPIIEAQSNFRNYSQCTYIENLCNILPAFEATCPCGGAGIYLDDETNFCPTDTYRWGCFCTSLPKPGFSCIPITFQSGPGFIYACEYTTNIADQIAKCQVYYNSLNSLYGYDQWWTFSTSTTNAGDYCSTYTPRQQVCCTPIDK